MTEKEVLEQEVAIENQVNEAESATDIAEVEQSEDQDPIEPEQDIVKEELPFKVFEKADYRMKCSCGHEVLLAEGISGGMQYVIPATDTHALDIQCPKCLHSIKFYFTENTSADEDNAVETTDKGDEQVLQEDKKEEQV